MDAKTVERRRWLFWELFSSDTFYVRDLYPAIGQELIDMSESFTRSTSIYLSIIRRLPVS